MQAKNLIEISSVFQGQKSHVAAVLVFSANNGGLFEFIRNRQHNNCQMADLVVGLSNSQDLKNVILVGSMTLLHKAGLTTKMLSEKGAVTDLATLSAMIEDTITNTPEDRETLKVLRDHLEWLQKAWKTGLLATTDVELNTKFDDGAIDKLSCDWYENRSKSDNELVDILHKRITRYVDEEARDYLSQYEQHARDLKESSKYESEVNAQVLSDYKLKSLMKVDLNKDIKALRDNVVLDKYRHGQLSDELSRKLDAEVRDKIVASININCDKFTEDFPAVAMWIYNEAHEKHKGKPVDRMSADIYNSMVIEELIVTWKDHDLSSGLKAGLVAFIMPMIQKLELSADEENAITSHCVDSLVAKPKALAGAAKEQFADTVKSVIKDAANSLVCSCDNADGVKLMNAFCREVLDHWKCTSTPASIKLLFNAEIADLLRKLSALIDRTPGFFNQAGVNQASTRAPVGVSAQSNKAELPGPSGSVK